MEKTWDTVMFIEGAEDINQHFKKLEDILFILGKGFDPRQCKILKQLRAVVSHMDLCLVDYTDPATEQKNVRNESRSLKNYEEFLVASKDLDCCELSMPMYHGQTMKKTLIISESVRTALTYGLIKKYRNIAIDVSAMPRGVGFSIIKRLLDIKTEEQRLHILVCENSEYDDRIKPTIVDESAEFLPGFNTFSMSMEQNDEDTVWLPLLGLHEERAFDIIASYLKPVEICPVVPFPSMDIRRGENILRSCGNLIFQERAVERRNIIYVPENNPLLVYDKLYSTVQYYERAFSTKTGTNKRYAFSSQSSKLMDIGLLLAVIDLNRNAIKTGIVIVENEGYSTKGSYFEENERVYCLSLDDNIFGW